MPPNPAANTPCNRGRIHGGVLGKLPPRNGTDESGSVEVWRTGHYGRYDRGYNIGTEESGYVTECARPRGRSPKGPSGNALDRLAPTISGQAGSATHLEQDGNALDNLAPALRI